MKKLCVGVLLASAFLFAQAASADPCGLCQAYYPCDWSCEHCVEGMGGPGLWTNDGYCWGEVMSGTCGDTGQCSGPNCGNGLCQSGETCATCAADCGNCCGNGVCQGGETCTTCPGDCGACPPDPVCPNGLCEQGETCTSCEADCGTCPPNGCNPPSACQPVCDNGICEQGETCSSCARDCGSCPGQPRCGDGVCDLWFFEDCGNCWSDCCPGGGGEGQPCWSNGNCFGDTKCDSMTNTCCDSIYWHWQCYPMLD